jgi:thiamine-phosphate diphosphorylase
MHGTVPPLHALTSDVVLADPAFIATARTIMQDCRKRVAIHLRAVETSARRLLELALELRVIAEDTGSWVLVHDRVDIAVVAGIAGAQLTSHSLTIADARRIAPTMILGASIHSSAEAWLTAQSGADFLVAGHGSDVRERSDNVRSIVDAADGCPVIAVGGMTPERVHGAVRAGASGVAAMRGIWLADAALATRRYLAAYDEGLRR